MSWFSEWANPDKGYDEALEELKKYYDEAQKNVQPYNQNGQDVYQDYKTTMDNLLHPEKLEDEWVKNYEESELAKQNEAMGTQHGLNAASSMGLLGSSPAIQAIQSGTANIVAKDRQQYLDDLMKKYMAGIGITKDIYGTGADAAKTQSQNATNMGENSANLVYGKNTAKGSLFGNIAGTAGGLAGGVLGSVGGPIGTAVGTSIGNSITKNWNTTGGK